MAAASTTSQPASISRVAAALRNPWNEQCRRPASSQRAEPVAELSRGERRAKLGHKKSQVLARRCVDDAAQSRKSADGALGFSEISMLSDEFFPPRWGGANVSILFPRPRRLQ
jgi:hypothetical protein